jgi:hypothetical protein
MTAIGRLTWCIDPSLFINERRYIGLTIYGYLTHLAYVCVTSSTRFNVSPKPAYEFHS